MDLLALLLLGLIAAGAVLFIRQLRFGTAAQRLARILAEEGQLDRSHLPRTERGRVEPEAAALELIARQAAVDQAPDDWRAVFKLGVAYGDMRNPSAARAAARRAVALDRAQSRH